MKNVGVEAEKNIKNVIIPIDFPIRKLDFLKGITL